MVACGARELNLVESPLDEVRREIGMFDVVLFRIRSRHSSYGLVVIRLKRSCGRVKVVGEGFYQRTEPIPVNRMWNEKQRIVGFLFAWFVAQWKQRPSRYPLETARCPRAEPDECEATSYGTPKVGYG